VRRDDIATVEFGKGFHSVAPYPVFYPLLTTKSGDALEVEVLQQPGFGRRARRRMERYVSKVEEWLSTEPTAETDEAGEVGR
jgi:hypothetical protein